MADASNENGASPPLRGQPGKGRVATLWNEPAAPAASPFTVCQALVGSLL